jgi:hypothetical protein
MDPNSQFPHEISSAKYNIKYYVNENVFKEMKSNERYLNKVRVINLNLDGL